LQESPAFQIVWIISFIFSWETIFGSGGIDSLICSMGYQIVGHLSILQDKFRDLNFKETNPKKLSTLIEYHNQIFECFKTFKDIFAVVFFMEFIFVALATCILGFQAVIVCFTIN
jgi:hypothetical protein